MAERYGYRLTGKPRKETIPVNAIFTDTETADQGNGVQRLVLGCYEVWRVDADTGLPQFQIDSGEYHSEREFYLMVRAHLPCRVIAHNWNFDAAVLRIGATDNRKRYRYEIDYTRGIYPADNAGFAPFFITLNFGDDRYAELICNTNFYKMPLAVIGDSLGVEKLAMPPTDDLDALTIYCRRDTEILRKAWFNVFAFTHSLGDTTPGLTAAMASNRVYRKMYFNTEYKVQGSQGIPYVNEQEQAAYHGGRTDTFWKGTPQSEVVFKYDVNSLYPYCMLGNIPVRYSQRGNARLLYKVLDGTIPDMIAMADVSLNIPPGSKYGFLGLEGVKHNGQLIFPVGRFRVTAWQPILEIAREQGYIEAVNNVWLYDAVPMFDTYVNELFARRVQYKTDGNRAWDTLTKLLMNSLYGKFGQRENPEWERVNEDSDEYLVMYEPDTSMSRTINYYNDVLTDYWQIGDTLLKVVLNAAQQQLARQSICSIAGYITAKGRAVLWDGLASVIANGGTLYMADTDSIITDIELPPSIVSGTELGKYKLEDKVPGIECYFTAPKHYIIGDTYKLKGVRNPVRGVDTHEQVVFPKFMTDLLSKNPARRLRLETGAIIRDIEKTPTGINSKRIENGIDAPTLPIVI